MAATPVVNIHDFQKKWGLSGWRLVLEEFIRRAPEFPGDKELAKVIGEIVTDLDTALVHLKEE